MDRMKTWAVLVSTAGFLFGFDTVVISGIDKELQSLWHSSDVFHGTVVMGMALWGTVVGAILGGIPADLIGRKKSLIWIGILFTVSAVGSALAGDPISFSIFRFIGGLGIGASTISAPAYISEISPNQLRGRLVSLYQCNVVFGIFVAFVSNYLLNGISEDSWRWMVGVEAIPAIIFTLLICYIPKSPRWLVTKGRMDEAEDILLSHYEVHRAESILRQIKGDMLSRVTDENIWMKKYRFPLMLAFLIAFFNQLSGINALLYYAPRIFEESGLGQSSALLSSAGIGVTMVVFTLMGFYLIDRLGRKHLMFIGSIGYIFSLTLVALSFYLDWGGVTVPIFLFIFIAAHSVGQGTVIWVFISEIFPNHLRSFGQAFGSSVHWILAALIPSLIPVLFTRIGPAPVFTFFAVMMVLQLLFVIFMMPETKGISLELMREVVLKFKGQSKDD